jgi:hypothetical protein
VHPFRQLWSALPPKWVVNVIVFDDGPANDWSTILELFAVKYQGVQYHTSILQCCQHGSSKWVELEAFDSETIVTRDEGRERGDSFIAKRVIIDGPHLHHTPRFVYKDVEVTKDGDATAQRSAQLAKDLVLVIRSKRWLSAYSTHTGKARDWQSPTVCCSFFVLD